MSIPLRQEVAEQLSWLFKEPGFRVVDEAFDPESFGDSFVTLESACMRVRFVRDRGQVFTEVAALVQPDNWWSLHEVCKLIGRAGIGNAPSLATAAELLRSNLPVLTQRLGPEFVQTKRELERRAAERKQALLSKQWPGESTS